MIQSLKLKVVTMNEHFEILLMLTLASGNAGNSILIMFWLFPRSAWLFSTKFQPSLRKPHLYAKVQAIHENVYRL